MKHDIIKDPSTQNVLKMFLNVKPLINRARRVAVEI